VVATDVGGVAATVRGAARLTPAEPGALADVIGRLLEIPEELAALRAEALRVAPELPDAAAMLAGALRAYGPRDAEGETPGVGGAPGPVAPVG
jgi:hypothetical protein